MDLPGISFSETDGQVFLRCEPALERAPVDSAALKTLLTLAGFGDLLLHEEAIASAARDCTNTQEPFERLVAQRSDAAIQIQIAPDEMAADISFTSAHGGKALAMEDLMRALVEAGVLFGVDEAALQQAWACGGDAGPVRVARGVSPEDGMDTVFEELIPEPIDRAPKLDENGLIDYREHGCIAMVQSGAPLMRRIPPTPGVVGHSIRGRVLAPHAGHDEPFAAALAGAQVASNDPNLLQAAVSGMPVRVKSGIMIEPILRVAEVNMTTGNIHYDGTVQIDGDVLQSMKVQASGDIVVGGMVDGGLLEAGGNIKVTGGVIAHAKLRAGGSVSARFAQGVHIYAGTVIALDDMALECELQSLNQIIIGVAAPTRGRLIGGSATAMMLIKTPLLGSAKAGVMQLVLGANPELEAKYQALQERAAKEKLVEENLEKIAKQLTATGDPKGLLERVKASRAHAVQVWGKSLVELAELEKQIALGRAARVEVGIGVVGAADILFGKLKARLRQEFGAGNFSVDADGQVVFIDAGGFAVPIL
ncbi:MAG: DUF342 domain-containing protein [Rhodoferax sp.]